MVMAHFVENFWVREGCWTLCGFRSLRVSAADLGLRALRAVAAPRAGPASSDRRLLRPARVKPVGWLVSGRPDPQARSPCGGRVLSARPSVRGGDAEGLPAARAGTKRRMGRETGPGPAGDSRRRAPSAAQTRTPGPRRGRSQTRAAGECRPGGARLLPAPQAPILAFLPPHHIPTNSRAGLGWISTSSRLRSSARGSVPGTLPLGLFTKRRKVEFNVTGFLGLKCTDTSPCALCSFPFLILSTPVLLTPY